MNSYNFFSVLIIFSFLTAEFQCNLMIADDTLWCGNGNKADSCDSLGNHAETDSCCRTHDYCPYTFSTSAPSYNGYSINSLVPLSHCDCDLIFSECLTAKPYKTGSYYIYETYYEELDMKCFAYLPCSNWSSTYDNLFNMEKTRRTGECYNGFKVTVFDSIYDYSEFMKTKPTLAQKEIIKHALETNVDVFMSDAKKNAKCLPSFPSEHLRMVDVFTRNFLKSELTTTNPTTTKTIEESVSDEQIKGSKNDAKHVKLFGYNLNESMAIILFASGLLIPAIIILTYLLVQYVKKTLTSYTSIKLHPNRSEAHLI